MTALKRERHPATKHYNVWFCNAKKGHKGPHVVFAWVGSMWKIVLCKEEGLNEPTITP